MLRSLKGRSLAAKCQRRLVQRSPRRSGVGGRSRSEQVLRAKTRTHRKGHCTKKEAEGRHNAGRAREARCHDESALGCEKESIGIAAILTCMLLLKANPIDIFEHDHPTV